MSDPASGWPRAVLFDFDGTLADSYAAITASVNYVRSVHGLSDLPDAEIRKHVGRGLEKLLADVLPGTNVERSVELYRQHHVTVMRDLTQLLPGAREALKILHASGRRLAVCSNKKVAFTRDLLDHFGIAEYFTAVLGPDDVPQPKPAPDMVLEALHRLRVTSAAALYVGDMDVDVQTARSAGVTVWVVPTGSADRATLVAAHPDRILENLSELTEWAAPRP